MTANQIIAELKGLGSENYKRTIMRHGVVEPVFGVSVEAMKQIVKRVRKDHQLALELYDSGIYDAMYLAGLIADDAKMSKKDLQRWADRASCSALSESTVSWVAAESPHGWEMALRWIDSDKERVASAGWSTLGGLMAIKEDAELDLPALKRLLQRVEKTIHQQPDRVRYAMNGFVIGAGCYVHALTEQALRTADAVGTVSVDMGETACKVPDARASIEKVKARGTLGKKRKTVKC